MQYRYRLHKNASDSRPVTSKPANFSYRKWAKSIFVTPKEAPAPPAPTYQHKPQNAASSFMKTTAPVTPMSMKRASMAARASAAGPPANLLEVRSEAMRLKGKEMARTQREVVVVVGPVAQVAVAEGAKPGSSNGKPNGHMHRDSGYDDTMDVSDNLIEV